MKRIVWLDCLKGFLIITVVLGHSIHCSHLQLEQDFIHDTLWRIIYSFHMPTFIAVSGYVAYNLDSRGGHFSIPKGILRRFRQLFIPFLLWSLFLFFIQHNVVHFYDYFIHPNNSLWFLWALFFISSFFMIIDWISQSCKAPQILLMSLASVLLLILMIILEDAKFLGVEYISFYFFFYILGYYFHKYSLIERLKNEWIILAGLIWIILAYFWQAREVPQIMSSVSFLPSGIIIIGYRIMTAIIAIILLLGIFKKWVGLSPPLAKGLLLLGNVSLGIYAAHMVIRFQLSEYIYMLFPNLTYWQLLVIIFISLIVLSYLIVWLLGKWRVTSVWLLGKLNK